jgi:NADPH:quinone reductase-like Zn-dependent oxidoreductase
MANVVNSIPFWSTPIDELLVAYHPELPASSGIGGVGIVEAVGPGVQGPTAGSHVILVHTWNTWREQIVCPVDRLVPVPDGLDDPAAATSYINPERAGAGADSERSLL